MKLLISLLFIVVPCLYAPVPKTEFIEKEPPVEVKSQKSFTARVTYWSPVEDGYSFGKRVAWHSEIRAKEGITVAVDASKIAYGTRILIPALKGVLGDGVFTAQDTGSAVKSLKAIPKVKRKEINHVIDIYVETNEKMNYLSNRMPRYMEVIIL